MAKVAVIGGGASGVSAIYYLIRAANLKCSRVLLLESSDKLGGWIQSSRFDDGTIYEHGPRSLRGAGLSGHNTLLLAEELGLEEDIIPVPRSHPAGKNRFIYAKRQICPLPTGPGGLFRRLPPFSKSLAAQGWKEPFTCAKKMEDDTVYNFFSRRFSEEIAKYAVDPLCRGVYAGDAKKLSVRACMTSLFDYEQKYGSVIKGAFKAPKNKIKYDSALVDRYKKEKWALWSFKQGLLHLTESIEAKVNQDKRVEIKTNTPCERISFSGKKVMVTHSGKEEEFDHVICAAPSSVLAPLVESQHPLLSKNLSSIPAVSVGVVSLEYEGTKLPYEGFGHLIPSAEDSKVMGVLYESCIFPEHDNKDKDTTKLTCMMGGSWFKELFGDPDKCDPNHLSDVAISAISEQLGLKSDPYRVVCRIQKDCIPQYVIGHSQRCEDMFSYIKDNNLPLSLVGASYLGPSINDCLYNTKKEVDRIAGIIKT